jgi:hypothetical protein
MPFEYAMRATPRMVAFMPGASPPVVTIPIVFNNQLSCFNKNPTQQLFALENKGDDT